MIFDCSCRLDYTISGQATLVFNIHPTDGAGQRVLNEHLQLSPVLPIDALDDASGNRYFRVSPPQGAFSVSYSARVEGALQTRAPESLRELAPHELPLDVLPYLYPSRYCQSDRLVRLAQAQFQNAGVGYTRVASLCNWIYDHIEYQRGSSDEHTSAFDIVTERAGVCRDFAHLGIAFCRALQIPARFATAYAYGLVPPDFHACFEAYLGSNDGDAATPGAWYWFDATRQAPQTGVVRIGVGRDAADVPFASLFGAVGFSGMQVSMQPAPMTDGSPARAPDYTVQAVAVE